MDKNDNEKLNSRVSSEAVSPNGDTETSDENTVSENSATTPDTIYAEVEKAVKKDLDVIRSLMETGLVDRQQGQNLMTEVIENAYRSITNQNETPDSVSNDAKIETDGFTEFLNSKPGFFNNPGREEVFNYLKNSNVDFDKDELLQISELIEAIEKSAVDRYLQKLEYGKTLNDENKIAKQRLTANAQNSNAADNNMVFTRSQIGQMSGDEFAKYESLIMEQLRKGLIH
ncbi:hypothetical protein J6S88_04160 [bacterium]|nr:hypothetical protein [bacterium]